MTATYDLSLVALSLLVAMVAAYTALDLASRIARETGVAKRDWLIAGAFVLGTGIWAMHFIGMLAFHVPIRLGFHVGTTLLSIIPAVAASGFVLHLIQASALSRKQLALGSVVMGAGIGAMHYIGMAAIVLTPPMTHEPWWFALSIVYAVAASAVALLIATRHQATENEAGATRRKLVAAAVMGCAITGMHYMGMQAAIIPQDSVCVSGFQGESLPFTYQKWLVVLSIAIAVMSAYTALDVSSRVAASVGRKKILWLAGGGIAMGMGIWSMHFIGMLALHTDYYIEYHKLMTFFSMVPAVAASTFALYMVARGSVTPRILAVSGVLMGSGIGAMHYIGMAAMLIEENIRYDPTFFAISILVAVSASISALWIAFKQQALENTGQFAWRKVGGALVMGFAISGMHYTGMTATHILPHGSKLVTAGLDPAYLAVFVGFSTFLVLLLAYVMAFYDARLAEMNARIAAQLRDSNERLQIRANDLATAMTAEIRSGAARDRTLATIVEQSNEAIITTDMQGVIQSWNTAARSIFGHAPEKVIGTKADMLYLPGSEANFNALLQHLSNIEDVYECKATLVNDAGQPVHVSSSVSPHYDEHGQHIGKIAIIRDVTRQVVAERALRTEKELAQVTLQSIGDAVVVTDAQGLIKYLNPAAESLLGLETNAAAELPFNKAVLLHDEMTREALECPVARCLRDQAAAKCTGNAALINARGEEVSVENSAAPIFGRNHELTGVVVVLSNVNERRKMEHDIRWQAAHDALTGLANRRTFEERIVQAVASARSANAQHALLYLDLDQFKVVNDTSGHAAGDQMLRDITTLLKDRIRDTDTLARLGGDEFGVLLINCPFDSAVRVAENLRERVADFHFVSGERSHGCAVSIGLVPITDNSHNVTQLMIAADAACYVAKEKGRNRIWAEQHGGGEVSRRQNEMEWVTRLNRALAESRLVLYGQPIMPVHGDNKDTSQHVEMLVRMIGDDGELVSPGAFIPAAERYGLIARIDRWVVSTALQRFSAYYREKPDSAAATLTINLSGNSLNDDDLVAFIREHISLHPLPASCVICFEITETAAIGNLSSARRFIADVRACGCQFSLDDFGSGMSSFSYLKNLPIDYLKIDGGFVRDMTNDLVDHALVETIHRVGRLMSVKTIAEHVENQAILDSLKRIGVDYVQGYHVARPMPLDAFFERLESAERRNISAA
jgi:diguanylate cyclase (GGDEF)-like protein/PAS domain S-box-containing protein